MQTYKNSISILDKFIILKDDWLTELFTKPVFKLVYNNDKTNAQLSNSGFYYTRIDCNDINTVRALCKCGFYPVDVSITFTWHDSTLPICNSSIQITPNDTNAELANLASRSFKSSRFHLDPQVDNKLANNIKHAWIKNYLNKNRGNIIWGAYINKQPVGFLAAITSQDRNNLTTAIIDLIAVDPSYQGQYVGSTLLYYFLSYYKPRAAKFTVGTQAANIKSLNFYQKNGFFIEKSEYVLHLHY